MPIELQERRDSDLLAGIIDNALDLASRCGWRYALAYLISEGVPSETIQRLLAGGERTRRRARAPGEKSSEIRIGAKGRNTEEMTMLFDSLNRRRA
ncbi:hypothetical protein ACHMW6_17625 [Pseudoduganella sp. UC29_106]|uniref:hypothetical protein n=1 Tax=Pseudoduganella sp. UC29_106 TaxID=3374553 RepID=UPI00375759EA